MYQINMTLWHDLICEHKNNNYVFLFGDVSHLSISYWRGLGSLSNDDGDGNESGKKAIGLD